MTQENATTTARDFLATLFDDVEGNLAIWTSDKTSRFFPNTADGRVAAINYATTRATQVDVYFSVGLLAGPPPRGRGKAKDVIAIGGLWADIDYGPGHKKPVPPDEVTARGLLAAAGPPPSIIIHSGGGLHAYWLLCTPLQFANTNDRERARRLSQAWQARIRSIFEADGFTLDPTHDLARLLRLPGTQNRKLTGNIRPVRVEHPADGLNGQLVRYSIEEVMALVGGPAVETGPAAAPEPVNEGPATETAVSVAVPPPTDLPREKLVTLLQSDQRFAATWNKERPDLPSASEYDLSLATRAMAAGWAEAEIVELLRAWRIRHGEDPGKLDRVDYVRRTLATARQSSSSSAKQTARFEAPDGSGLVLTLSGQPRRTPTRTSFRVNLCRAGENLGTVTITDTSKGIRDAAQALSEMSGGVVLPQAIRSWLPKGLDDLAAQAPRVLPAGPVGGNTMLTAITEFVGAEFDVRFRDAEGRAWSECQRRWLRRQDVVAATPPELLKRLRACVDAPRDAAGEVVNDSTLVYHMTRLLGVTWAGLLRNLPVQHDATSLTATSAAAAEFRRALIRLWLTAKTWVVTEETDVSTGAVGKVTARASMLSRANQRAKTHLNGTRQPRGMGWQRILDAVDGWWRVVEAEGGQRQLWLAMRYTLADQVGILLPGVVDQGSLRILAKQYELAAEDDCAPSGRLGGRTGGGAKLLVLSRELTDDLLAEPAEDEPEDARPDNVQGGPSPQPG